MKAPNKILLLIILLLCGCASLKKEMTQTGESMQAVAIHNAILDFSNSCKLYKNDSVFSVNFNDSVFNEAVLIRDNEGAMHWKRGSLYSSLVSVEISASPEYKFLITSNTKVGYKGHLPSRHIIKDGKLFYWFDDSYPLTQEMLDLLWKYNLLQDDDGGLIISPDNPINDRQKCAHYYFCKSDLSKYKRVITNIGLGYYKPPKLKCIVSKQPSFRQVTVQCHGQ
jgi:hypothetical protein